MHTISLGSFLFTTLLLVKNDVGLRQKWTSPPCLSLTLKKNLPIKKRNYFSHKKLLNFTMKQKQLCRKQKKVEDCKRTKGRPLHIFLKALFYILLATFQREAYVIFLRSLCSFLQKTSFWMVSFPKV